MELVSVTDILATLGPSCASVETLAEMIRAGMSVARMNFSHGDYAFHSRMAALVREAAHIVAGDGVMAVGGDGRTLYCSRAIFIARARGWRGREERQEQGWSHLRIA